MGLPRLLRIGWAIAAALAVSPVFPAHAQPVESRPRQAADLRGAESQTRDKPSVNPALEARARALFEAIAEDDPDRALPFFFPLSAYEQVKAVGNPARDWNRRLVANYTRDIHALAKEVARTRGTKAAFARIEVPNTSRWVEPNEEYNRLGYHRVYGARIVWTDGSDKEHAIRISSMISWRGEWYVVHLTGFK